MSTFLLGATGVRGSWASWTTLTLTGEVPEPCGVSSWLTSSPNCCETALAMSWARTGLVSRTWTLSSTVSRGLSALTSLPIWSEVSVMPSSFCTAAVTRGLPTMSAYDLTRWVAAWLPSSSCDAWSVLVAMTLTYIWAVASYVGFCRNANERDAPRHTSRLSTMSAQRLRTTRR